MSRSVKSWLWIGSVPTRFPMGRAAYAIFSSSAKLSRIFFLAIPTLGLAGDSSSGVGTGGMATKLRAASRAGESGVPTLIAPGKQVGVLDRALSGEPLGTFVHAPAQRGTGSRKRWLLRDLRPLGQVVIDDGAARALCERGKSLLPTGIRDVRGTFEAGEPVEILSLAGTALARGFSSYGSDELRRIVGVKTADIPVVLGFKLADEAVHRDDLVLLSPSGARAETTGAQVAAGATKERG